MFKKILLSSVLLTGALGTSTALAQTDNVSKPVYTESKHSASTVESNFHYGLIDFNFSTRYIVDELLPVENGDNAVIGIFNDKPFEYNVILRNVETNELIHGTATGGPLVEGYKAEVPFSSLKAGTYQVILEDLTGTEQKGQFGMYTYKPN
ncbi:hypothetical protein [Priestia taiwanensis]|uniref:DUF3244 domain-containing protein n=1 Tax=Priestia taiwanensis TaxID=1347902 RepID=A0A917ELC3_9BACI|nr:hypothetical protein [Priestia taiwanensis]MBM7361940.1 hypothetical protein [Priestia taiwanensis]GGE58213.1 hypothetical protein GCM10007140_05680 [Priestia taiwanensis]